jgi:3-oxoacyl-[acyl-carrier protein] reductase
MDMRAERAVLVTGGTRGIGLATALRLTVPGAAVFVTCTTPSPERAAEVEKLILSKGAAHAEVQCWSTEDPEAAQRNIDAAAAAAGRLDVLVNNAGLTKDALMVRMTDQDFRKVLEVNLFGVFNCSRAAAKIMMKQRSGRIISVSSVVAFTGNPGQANYSASKAGLVGMTRTLALELAPRGVTVNAVAPGFIETDMTAALSPKVKESLAARIPLGYVGKPEDVAEAVAFLASDAASYVTGQTLHVNGGMHV